MRPWMVVVGAACALAGTAAPAAAQFGSGDGGWASGTAMPGQQVGSVFKLNAAGQVLPKAVPQAGDPVGTQGRKYDPSRPLDVFKGTNIDPASVVAPVAGYPGTGQDPTLLDRLYTKLGSLVGLSHAETVGQTPNVTPGIFRRNRQRAAENRMWRAD